MEISQVEENLKKFHESASMLKQIGSDAYWNNMIQFTYEYLLTITDKSTMCICCKLLLNFLTEFDCSDKSVIARILEFCWKVSTSSPNNERNNIEACDIWINDMATSLNLYDKKKYTLDMWSWGKAFFVAERIGVNIVRVLVKYGLYDGNQDICYHDFLKACDFLTKFW